MFDWIRSIFNQIDKMITRLTGANYTMAESNTPGASALSKERRHVINPSEFMSMKEEVARIRSLNEEVSKLDFKI